MESKYIKCFLKAELDFSSSYDCFYFSDKYVRTIVSLESELLKKRFYEMYSI